LKVVYSYNKRGYEADYWQKEIAGASDARVTFVPFNHDPYLDVGLYTRAQLLDNLYSGRHAGLLRMYTDLEALLRRVGADALIVDNCFPYHPEFLRKLEVYKVLRTTDGPVTAYDRDFAYLHAYDHVMYHTRAYSADLTMPEKLAYCGARSHDFVPLGLFDAAYDGSRDEAGVFSRERDVDIVFIGAQYPEKMPLLAAVKKAFGRRFVMHGLTSWKRNLYFNVVHGVPGWIGPIPFEQYVPLYQRAKIGINVHNRGKYTVGSYRLFDLPGNGVMQISDGGEYLGDFFSVGREVVGYDTEPELIEKIRHYLEHDEQRVAIARAGYRRVLQDYRFGDLLRCAAEVIREALDRRRLTTSHATVR
jgi:spore maturation protein CgeB